MRKPITIPALLVALPLVAIGALASHSLRLEYLALANQRSAAAAAELRATETTIRGRLDETVESLSTKVVRGWSHGASSDVRGLITAGAIDFVVIHEGDHRVFPPEDGASVFFPELRKLQLLASAISSSRADFATNPATETRGELLRLGDDPAYSLFHCRRLGRDGDICILLSPAFMRMALDQIIAGLTPEHGQSPLALRDPEGMLVAGSALAAPTESQVMSGIFRGWQLEAAPPSDSLPLSHDWTVPLAITVPLLVSWLILAWHFNQSQQLRLEETARRAGIAAQLSHELRTPLANLRLYTDLVRRRVTDTQAIGDYCGVMEVEIDRLERLTENAIAFARSEAHEPMTYAEAAPDETLQAIVARLQPLLAAASCTVTLHGGAGGICRFDVASFERIAVNLIDNARKYAGGGLIEIATSVHHGRLHLAVRDHGPGVPPADRESIFEPLNRGRRSGTDGFGLGLAAVRRLARSNGGDAMVEDARPGARFVVTIRVATSTDAKEIPQCVS